MTDDRTEDRSGDGSGPHDLGYEDARAELVEVVRTLEAGGTTLEESLALWERGERLADVCQQWLDGARRRLDAVRTDPDEPDDPDPDTVRSEDDDDA